MSAVTGAGGGTVQRKLVVGVEFQANTAQANRAMEDLANRAAQVEKNMTAAQRAANQLTYVGGPNSRVIGMAPPPAAPGAPPPNVKGSFSDQFLQVAGATAAVQTIAGLADGIVRLARESGLARERVVAFTSAVPYLGSVIQSLANTAFGLNDLIEEGGGDGRRSASKIADRLRLSADRDLYGTRLGTASAAEGVDRQAALRADRVRLGVEFAAPAAAGAALVGGAFEQTDPRVQDARDASRRAAREAAAARLSLTRSLSPLDRAEARAREQFAPAGAGGIMGEGNIAQLTSQTRQLYGEAAKNPYAEPEFRAARRDLAGKADRGAADLAEMERAVAEARQRAVESARADYELARAKTGELRAQVEVLREQEQRVRGGARSFGAMDPMRQFQLLQDAEEYKRVGFDNLTPDQKQRLLADPIAGPRVGQDAERAGAESPLFQRLLEIFGQRSAEDLKEARVKLEQEVRVKVEFDEQKLAEAMDKALKTFDERVKDIIVKQAQLAEAKATLNQTAGNAAQK